VTNDGPRDETRSMFTSAVALRMDAQPPQSWDDLVVPMIAIYPAQLFLPVLHHLVRTRGGERRKP